jgi:hypothetical protein
MRADGQPVSPCRHPMPHFDSCLADEVLADEVLADEVQGRLNSYRISQFFGRRPGCAPPSNSPASLDRSGFYATVRSITGSCDGRDG